MKQHLILKEEFWKDGRAKTVCGLTEGQDVYGTTHYGHVDCEDCLKVIPPTIEINGKTFTHGEEVKVKYRSSIWSVAKIEFVACPRWVGFDSGWYIKDCIGDLRNIKSMDDITKNVGFIKKQ